MLSNYMKESNLITVDYDGTLSLDGYTICKKALKYIPKIKALGINIVLWTCRCDERYDYAKSVVKSYNLPIEFIEEFEINNKPRKVCSLYNIDDRSVPGGKINWYKTYRYIKKEINKCKEK